MIFNTVHKPGETLYTVNDIGFITVPGLSEGHIAPGKFFTNPGYFILMRD